MTLNAVTSSQRAFYSIMRIWDLFFRGSVTIEKFIARE
jgi:hypothetical protein